MLSTMQDGQLSLANLLRHGTSVHSASEVITWTGSEARRETYGDLGRNAARLANALRSLGVTGDQRVGTFMWNNAEHLAAYLAVPAMGAVLHTLNIRLFPEQLVFVANHAEDQVVIVDGTLVPLLAKQLPEFKTVRHVIVANGDAATLQAPDGVQVHSYADLLAGQPDTFDWPEIDERSAAAMCYTSGTTGDPKGVVYSHRSIWLHSMQVCMSDSMNLAQHDKALAIVPQFHAMAWGLPYAALMVGASLVMPDRFLQPAPLAALLAAEKPTFAGAVPTVWQGLLAHLEAHPQDISHLREVVVGGSAVPPSLMHAFEERHHVRILHAWGMTETSPLGSVARPPASATGDEAWRYRYTQGRFPAAVSARLIDDDGAVLPWDNEAVGELEVRGPWIAGAYYGGGRCRPRQVPRRLAAHRRRRQDQPGRLPDADRPRQGRHQVRRRVDLLGRPGEPGDGPPGRRRGRGGRHPRREVGRAAAGRRRAQGGPDRHAPRSCASSSATRSRSGSCRRTGRSWTKCPRRASASSTRSGSARPTPRESSTSHSSNG